MSLKRKNILKAFFLSMLLGFTNLAHSKDINISAKPIDSFLLKKPDQIQFGQLEFLGGLELSSKNKNFGGLSGLRLSEGGKTLFAVTDQGHFLKANIVRGPKGKILSIENAKFSRLQNRKGDKLKGKKNADAESLEISGNQYLIGFERNHRVEIFNLNNDTLRADKTAKAIDFSRFHFPNNKGPEAIAVSHITQELFVFAEYALDKNNHHQGFVFREDKIAPIAVTLTPGLSLTDAHFLPNGDLLLLERFYTPITGQAMRIRKFAGMNLKPNTILSGEIIMQATSQMEIDNMEGLAVTKMQDGSTRLTLISDDNFSRNQRTIILEFKLKN